MPITKLWNGHLFGTNTGNLALKLDGDDNALRGTLRLNDNIQGVGVFRLEGQFDGVTLQMTGIQEGQDADLNFRLSTKGVLSKSGEIDGEWSTTAETGGTFKLYPSPVFTQLEADASPNQIFTSRYDFSAVVLDKNDIIKIADEVQKHFANRVVISAVTASERVTYVPDFQSYEFSESKARIVRIIGQEPDRGGINRVITIEFGPTYNFISAQGTDEAVSLGFRETFKRIINVYERSTFTKVFKLLSVNFATVMLFGALILAPGIPDLRGRAIFVAVLIAIIGVVQYVRSTFIPHALIYLKEKPTNWAAKAWPSLLAWIISIVGGVIATVLASYLTPAQSPKNAQPSTQEVITNKSSQTSTTNSTSSQ